MQGGFDTPAITTVSRAGTTGDRGVYARLRAAVLLAGSVRPSQLSRSIGRSLLDLPIDDSTTVGSHWHAQGSRLAREVGVDSLPMRILVDRAGLAPNLPALNGVVRLQVERDAAELRGTGGLLRDCAREYAPTDQILVANAGQILVEPLEALASELIATGADVAMLAHRDGTPGGLFLVSCHILSEIRDIGFLDFKEQVLPKLAAQRTRIAVVQRPRPTGYPVRTLDGYISGLRAWHRLKKDDTSDIHDPFLEDWYPTFSLKEDGATVSATATVHDSVVLKGARVEERAVVVRSIVCPGAVVKAGEIVADRIVRGKDARAAS